MKYAIALSAVLIAGSALSISAQAPAAAPAGPTKIAVIAFQAAVTQTNEFQRNYADLQKKYDPKRQQLKALNDEIETLKKQLQTQGDTLSDEERERRARSINDKEKQLQRDTEDDRNDFQQDMQETFNGVASKVGDTLINYAQQRGFTLVLDGGNQQAQTVLYANPATDITRAIIEAYNQKSGIPAPAHPATAVAPRPVPRTPAQHTPTAH